MLLLVVESPSDGVVLSVVVLLSGGHLEGGCPAKTLNALQPLGWTLSVDVGLCFIM